MDKKCAPSKEFKDGSEWRLFCKSMFLVTDVLLLFIFQPQPQRRQGLLSQHQWKKTIIKFHPEECVLLFVIFVFNYLPIL